MFTGFSKQFTYFQQLMTFVLYVGKWIDVCTYCKIYIFLFGQIRNQGSVLGKRFCISVCIKKSWSSMYVNDICYSFAKIKQKYIKLKTRTLLPPIIVSQSSNVPSNHDRSSKVNVSGTLKSEFVNTTIQRFCYHFICNCTRHG